VIALHHDGRIDARAYRLTSGLQEVLLSIS
jgi:hypothetical protein